MRKFYFTLLTVLIFGVLSVNAQKKLSPRLMPIIESQNLTIPQPQQTVTPTIQQLEQRMPNGFAQDRCGFGIQMNRAIAMGYNPAEFEAAIQAKIEEIRAERAQSRTTDAVNYVIPVVFHIIHSGTAVGTGDNIPASQVYYQIEQLNKDFNNLSGSTQSAAASAHLTFCPVLKNPSGIALAEPGIDRISWISKGWSNPSTFTDPTPAITYIDATVKPNSIWDPTRYVNIWVYNIINSGILGYSSLPTAGPPDLPSNLESNTTAGVVYLPGCIGSVDHPGPSYLAPYNLGKTVTHELGHFFGLYHTWGNVMSGCGGTDYCNDTPPCSGEYYAGAPACFAPTQCSGQRRMIENYMDYSDDGCLNTFTSDQVDRTQAVMLLAPRRPKNPDATMCTPAVSNAISFTSGTTAADETGSTGTCPKYTDYTVSIAPSVSATGNATVTFNFAGSAVRNSDYDVIGSTSVSYTNGDNSVKSITIRVYDDGQPETTENIIISFTISGTGLVAGSTNQTHTVTITDNDSFGEVDDLNPVATLYSQNFDTSTVNTGGNLPVGWQKGSFLNPAGANIFTVNPIYGSATGFTTATNGRVLHITNTPSSETAPNTYSATSASDYAALTGSINTTGYRNIKLAFDYACVGEEDEEGVYDAGILRISNTAQTSGLRAILDEDGDVVFFSGTAAKTHVTVPIQDSLAANRANIWLGFEWINDGSVAGSPNVPYTIDNVMVTGEKLGVETVLSKTSSVTQMLNQSAQYISDENRIIARIDNLSENVGGCITSTIQQAGSGAINFNYSSTSGVSTAQRSEKVVRITPITANTTASYTLTLYFTITEMATWGANVQNLKIMKVKDGVSLSTVLNQSNTTIYPTTVDDQRTTKGYVAFTANVTGGFSQFMVAPQVTIPVSLMDFEARPNGKNILLDFNTVTESNNKGFVIERSTNGSNFERIGWVDGQGTTNAVTHYTYTDNYVQPNVLYYYRLRQTDFDGNEKLSEIRSAKIKNSGLLVNISPNPATDHIKLFISGAYGVSDIQLVNAAGQVVRKWSNVSTLNGATTLDVSSLSSGMYSIVVITSEDKIVQKLIIRN